MNATPQELLKNFTERLEAVGGPLQYIPEANFSLTEEEKADLRARRARAFEECTKLRPLIANTSEGYTVER
jgi:hypothetical protein